MAKPSSRDELKEYCLRKLGKPVLEINVDDDQISDCIDDGLQYFQERHYDGVMRMFLKYKFTEADVARMRSANFSIDDTDGQILTVDGNASNIIIESEIFVENEFDPKGILKYYNQSTNQIGIFLKNAKNKFKVGDVIISDYGNLTVTNILDKRQLQQLTVPNLPDKTIIPRNTKIFTSGQNNSGATGVVNTNDINTSIIQINPGNKNLVVNLNNPYRPFLITDTITIEGIGTYSISQVNQVAPNLSEALNYIEVPDWIIGVNRIFDFLDKSTMNIFDIRYQFRLNDLYDFSSAELLYYETVKTRLEFLYFILEGSKMIRFNKRMGRIYFDLDFDADVQPGDYIVLDCYRLLDPNDSPRVWQDMFLKKYTTALIKKQWGQNLIKYNNVQLPGGLTLNGREIYQDAVSEIKDLEERMDKFEFSEPPLDLIG